jgi:hypothetical protein
MSVRSAPRAAKAALALVIVVGAGLTSIVVSGSATHSSGKAPPAPPPSVPPTAPPPVASRSWAAAASSVATENARSGTPGWTVQRPSTSGQIEAYADQVSAKQGATV